MTSPYLGITIRRDNSEPRPAVFTDFSIVGLVLPSADADAALFPLNTPVTFNSTNATMLAGVGTGALALAVQMINAQLAAFQVAATLVVVRVAEGATRAETISNIVGSEAAGSGAWALLRAPQALGVTPRLLGACGFTGDYEVVNDVAQANPIVVVLRTIAARLLAHAVCDGPGVTKAEALAWRETINDDRAILLDGDLTLSNGVTSVSVAPSAAFLGAQVAVDFERAGVPGHSVSQRPVYGIVGLERYDSFSYLDGATDGQQLLAQNIGVVQRGEAGVDGAVASSGFILMAVDNAGSDPIWQGYTQTRVRDYTHLALIRSISKRIGAENISRHSIDAVLNDMAVVADEVRRQGVSLGWSVRFEPPANSPENLRLGVFRVSFAQEEPAPIRRIDIDSRRQRSALEDLIVQLSQDSTGLTG